MNTALNSGVSGSLQFSVDGVNVGSPVTVNGAGTYSVPYTITQGQGTYNVKALFTGATGAILGGSAGATLTVSASTVTLTPSASNTAAARVTSAGGTGSFQLTVSFQLPPALQGVDISKAVPVTTTLDPLVGTTTTQISCPTSTSVASGVLTATASCSSVPVNVYQATLTIGGSYLSGSSTSVISVFDPSLGAVEGGGTVVANGVNGTFAANVKYNKNGQPEGDVLYIAHKPGANVKLKSNALQSMSIVGNTVVILGKATVDGVGSYAFQATVVDQSATGDLFGLQVTDPSGKAVPELSFSPTQLTGGSIELPN
jgi:hypothetical protein